MFERVNEAVDMLGDASKLSQARGLLEQIVVDDPSVGAAQFNLGVARQLGNDLEGARKAYQTAVNIDPSLGEAWLYLGALQENAGKLDVALSNYRSGLRNDPENMELHVALIGVLRKQGRVDQAIDEAKEALKINANAYLVYNNMGLAYLDRGELALAKFIFQKALAIEGADENAFIQSNYGWTLFQMGEKGPATYRLKKAVELDANFVPALVYLASIYMKDHNYTDTVDLLERAAAQDPENHGVQMNLGVAYRGVGRLDDAEKAFNKALALKPGQPDPYFNLGILYGDYKKDYDAAVDAFQKYKQGGGSDVELVDEYIASVQKEKKRSEKRRKAEVARKKREAERAERKKLLEEEAKRQSTEDKKKKKRGKDEKDAPPGGDTPAEPPADGVGAELPPAEPASPEPEPSTSDPSTPDPSTPDPSTPDPSTPDPSTPDPSTPDPSPWGGSGDKPPPADPEPKGDSPW